MLRKCIEYGKISIWFRKYSYNIIEWNENKMKIALIAHDQKKDNLIQFAIAYRDILAEHELYAQGRRE